MKYFILISVLVFSAFSNTRDLVTNVNPIWNLDEFKDISLKVGYMPKSEVELIQLHLENVINVYRRLNLLSMVLYALEHFDALYKKDESYIFS